MSLGVVGIALLLVASSLVIGGCGATTPDGDSRSEDEDICKRARQHVESCTETEADLQGNCERDNARRLLDSSCDELAAARGKSDSLLGRLLCSVSIDHCTFSNVHVGSQYACGISHDGDDSDVKCWGREKHIGSQEYGRTSPPDESFHTIATGLFHACGILKGSGEVVCWGRGSPNGSDDGEQGDYDQGKPPEGSFRRISAGSYHTCGLREDGTVACWGDDRWGQATPPDGTFEKIDLGGYSSCGLREDGRVECWGRTDVLSEKAPEEPIDTLEVSWSGKFACGRIVNDSVAGRIVCWGAESYADDFGPVPEGDDFLEVAVGEDWVCATKGHPELQCWGGVDTPDLQNDDGIYSSISAGKDTVCGVGFRSSKVSCWDWNGSSSF